MPVQGQYLDKHSRKYVAYNPNEFNGPFTWRLSMMAADSEDPDAISTIFTILPIDSNIQPDGGMNLFFNIDGLQDVYSRTTRLSGKREAAALLNLPAAYKRRTLYGLEEITSVAPVQTDRRGSDVAIYFDINSLTTLNRRKGYFSVKANDYNSRSIDNLSADKPLFTTSATANDAIVTFDITSLDPA